MERTDNSNGQEDKMDITKIVITGGPCAGKTTAMNYGTTTMLMSPSLTGMARLSFKPWCHASNSLKTMELSMDGKYVGKQYMDNTMTDSRSIPAYFVSNLGMSYSIPLNKRSLDFARDDNRKGHGCHFDRAERVEKSSIRIAFYVNNVFNNMYYADGWCWKNLVEEDGAVADGIGVYPQAPINCMLKVSWRF